MVITEKYFETDRCFYKRLLAIAIPVILQNLITTGVNLVDNIMVGQLNEASLSGATQANQFIMLFTFAIMGISMGASVLCSRFYGARDMHSLKKAIAIAMRFGLLLGLVFTLAALVFPRQIISVYFRAEDVEGIAAGTAYLRWSTSTFLLTAVSYVLTNVMRSMNMGNIPLCAAIAAFSVNVGANYVLIFGKFGFPVMGVSGAALGTVIARVVETSIIVVGFLKNKAVPCRVRELLMPCRDLVGEFLRISVPVMVSDSLLGIGDSALAIIMGQIGSNFVSANSITVTVQRMTTLFISGLSYSGCFLTGQVLGEGRTKDAQKQGYTYVLLGLVIGVFASGLIQLCSGFVVDAYNIAQDTKNIAHALMDGVSIIAVFRAINSILTKGVLRGGGDTKFLMVVDMTTMWLLAIPLGAVAGLVWELPAFWIYLCMYSDQVVKAILCIFRLKSGKWIKKIQGAKE